MTGPAWLADVFAVVMIVTSAYCVSRLLISWRQRRPTDHDVDAVHVVMGIAMAGMLVPRLRVFWSGGWEVVFAAAAAWFAWHAIRGLRSPAAARRQHAHHHAQHLLACLATLSMLLAVRTAAAAHGRIPATGMSGSSARLPTLALVLAVALIGYVIWATDGLTSLAPVSAGPAFLPVPARAAAVGGGTSFSRLADGAAAASSGASAASSGASAASSATLSAHQAQGAERQPAERVPVSPRLAACCEIAMGVTMGYMLILML